MCCGIAVEISSFGDPVIDLRSRFGTSAFSESSPKPPDLIFLFVFALGFEAGSLSTALAVMEFTL